MATDDDLLEEAHEVFDLIETRESGNRLNWIDDVRFARLGEQWPSDVRQAREADNRPCLTINKLDPLVRQVMNDARQNKPGIGVHAGDSDSDVETAEIISGLVRHIEYASKADIAYDKAIEHAISGGFGYFRINTRYACDDTFDQDIVIEAIPNALSVYPDPYSTSADSADWNACFVAVDVPEAQYKRDYAKAEAVDWDWASSSDARAGWFDKEAKTLRIGEYWKREPARRTILALSTGEVVGEDVYTPNKALFDAMDVEVVAKRQVESHKVTQYILSGAEVLETNNWPGRYIPIIPVYGDEVNLEGIRHFKSLIRDAKDPQRNFNYWRTTATELVALAPKAPYIGKKGAFKTDPRWETANSVSHAFLEFDGDVAPQRQPFSGIPAGALQEALNAADDIKAATGIYDASLGARGNETSGIAIRERQGQSDVTNFHFVDNLSRGIAHAGTVILDLIPYVYPAPRIIRTLGIDRDPSKAQAVAVNQPTARLGPDGKPMMRPQTDPMGKPMTDDTGAALMEAIPHVYDLTAGRYDVIVKAGPSYNTLREEAAAQMMDLIKAKPDLAGVIGDLLAKNLDWPGADEIAKRLQALLPPEIRAQLDGGMQQGQQQDNGQAKQIIAQGAQTIQALQATIAHLQQQIQAVEGSAQADQTRNAIEGAKAQTGQFKAETDRIKVVAGIEHDRRESLFHGVPQPGAFAG